MKVKTFHGINGPYLTVYTLLKIRRFEICLHQFHRGDEDPDCHDHPFAFCSFILAGGYREFREDGTYLLRKPGSIRYRSAVHRHRVELLATGCWTFLIKFHEAREWGFWHRGEFIPWKDYIKSKGLTPIESEKI